MPTVEACKAVEDALSAIHGKVQAPKEIPAPSLEVTGCGEVPSVLDALIRTRLSASTTSQNAKYAFTGLVARYGVLEKGIGAGSVDWNKVRQSDVLEIEKAIKKGGLAKTKSVSIKKILEMVYEQNLARRDAFIKEKETGIVPDVIGAAKMTQGQKDMEIDVADKKVISLDFMHGLTADEAMTELVKYPGIGVKTASCVILFCLQRPSFAVDTHVWRFCKWLKWVPEGATRDQTFSHCEVRIPNDMKYSLHQLFIRHGKTCGRCRAITGEGSEGWETTVCPIEHLVERTGKRKAMGPPKKMARANKASKGKKAKKATRDDEEEEDIEMSDLTDIEEPELDDDDQEEDIDTE
jgi:endonuclease III